jgi:hypothetical protein
MAYLDGLPVASSVALADIIEIGQGGTVGVPGTATTRQVSLSLLLAGAGPFLPLIGGNVTGPLLLGTGTVSGDPYQFQSAISFDPSAAGASGTNYRRTMFNTTLTYAGTTTNVWEGVTAFTYVNGPGHANGEINGFHSYFQVNAGATMASAEGYETSMLNNGAIGTFFGVLSQQHNGAAGTATQVWGISFNLENENVGAGSVGTYASINLEPLFGGGSTPTNYFLVRGNDPLASISTKGGLAVGGLSNPGPGAVIINGIDTSGSSFPFQIKNSALTNVFLVDNAGTIHFIDAAGAKIDITGTDNSSGTFPLTIKNLANTNLFFVDNSGVTHFATGSWDASGNVTGATYKIGSNQVVGARQTGWTAMTGTPDIASSFATSTVTLSQLAERVLSIQAALTTHGLIGA